MDYKFVHFVNYGQHGGDASPQNHISLNICLLLRVLYHSRKTQFSEMVHEDNQTVLVRS